MTQAAAPTGYLGLGSNVGDRLAHLRAARDELGRHELRVTGSSSVYETEGVGGADGQRDFLNACLRIETALGPDRLLDACKRVEGELGRAQAPRRHAPREIDVDVLLLDAREHSSERLVLPHPDIVVRRFVLVPLLELDPELALPDGRSLAAALAALDGQRVEPVGAL